ncbi:MAG: aldo/keto reductase [Bacteroidota bacterium]
MKFKRLGNSGLLVSQLGLGTMLFGEESDRSTPEKEAIDMIDRFLDAGGNHIDTADVYAGGRSEEITGKALKGRRDKVVLATKVRFPTGEGKNDAGLSRLHIISEVEKSLKRLGTDYLDMYYMHCWDPLTPIEESMRAFDDLVTAGKVRYIGVSNFKAWQVMKAMGISQFQDKVQFVAAQYQYSLVKRDIEYEFRDLLMEENISLVPWGPLGGGFLTGKYDRNIKPVDSAAGRIGTTSEDTEEHWSRRDTEQNWNIIDAVEAVAMANHVGHVQVALAWVIQQPFVASTLIGARTMSQLEDNLKAATLTLSEEEMDKLNEVSSLPELYPYRMMEVYGERPL